MTLKCHIIKIGANLYKISEILYRYDKKGIFH
jgi:hypothetical protein